MNRITLSGLVAFIIGNLWLAFGFVLMQWGWMKGRGHGFAPSIAYYRDIATYCRTPSGILAVVIPLTLIVLSLLAIVYGVKRSCRS